jgi:hypothetical protein
MFHVPNKYRDRISQNLKSDDSFGNNGFFIISHYRIAGYEFRVMASDGMGWEHASVTIAEPRKPAKRCPAWEEMCYIKKLFWDETDCVIEYHPAKTEYVSVHPFCLHLWRPTDQVIPIPLKEMVG